MNPGLVVGIPFCGRPVAPEWALSLATQDWPMGLNIMYQTLKGLETGDARNRIVEEALKFDAKYLWFLDDDTAPPQFAVKKLYRLLEENPEAAVAAGVYCSRKGDVSEPIVFKQMGHGTFWHWKLNEVFECEGIGTGCMLIRMDVFRKLEKPWFKTVDAGGSGQTFSDKMTDDLFFCKKLNEAGYKILAHGGVLPIHWDAQNGIPHMLPADSYPLRVEDAIDRAMEITGWMDKPELVWLAAQAQQRKRIVELGSFLGRSTRVLGEHTQGTVTAVDNWRGPQEAAIFNTGPKSLLEIFQDNLHDLIESRKVEILVSDHETVEPDGKYDMVFVDGNHSKTGVSKDIQKWVPALTPDGIICGHDSDMEGVRQALSELLPDAKFIPGTRLWTWEKPKAEALCLAA